MTRHHTANQTNAGRMTCPIALYHTNLNTCRGFHQNRHDNEPCRHTAVGHHSSHLGCYSDKDGSGYRLRVVRFGLISTTKPQSLETTSHPPPEPRPNGFIVWQQMEEVVESGSIHWARKFEMAQLTWCLQCRHDTGWKLFSSRISYRFPPSIQTENKAPISHFRAHTTTSYLP